MADPLAVVEMEGAALRVLVPGGVWDRVEVPLRLELAVPVLEDEGVPETLELAVPVVDEEGVPVCDEEGVPV